MKVTVLTDVEKENDLRSYDAVVTQVVEALRKNNHDVSVLGVRNDVKKLVSGLRRRDPNLVFNLLEMFDDNLLGDVGVAGVLELLGLRYTGGGPGELYLRQDKALAKKLLAYERLAYPHFAVFTQNADFETGGNLRMPLFVKPLRSDASLGIDNHSLVRDSTELMKRVTTIHQKWHDAALVEEYVEGREFYIGIIGNREPTAFPPLEMDFSGLPEGAPRIVGTRAKWQKNTPEFKGTKVIAAQVPDEIRAKLQKTAVDAYRALRVRDYGRVDLRMTESNEIYVIEVNANCYLEQSSEFAAAAALAGMDYSALINRIIELALERYHV